ncbi:crossover junction endonuclease EME1-like [Daktulosphaira vitifoliae]|uniref:crossover junction endonuclease EME1-like n=1 Tax=Daktulosphaira vitifoliae TaxID=58002 RepID=UPI0021AAFE47|nr:crossover junction endonuclease EME1-like [Daktulosphaira vitifoliae]
MDFGKYNVYTISDSENESVILENCPSPKINCSNFKRDLSPDEPEFFHQVLKNQKKVNLETHNSNDSLLISESLTKDNQNFDDVCIITNNENLMSHKVKSKKRKVVEDNHMTELNLPVYGLQTLDEPKKRKRLTKDEIAAKKLEELKRRNERKLIIESLKRIKPSECIKYITVHIDANIQICEFSEDILNELKSNGMQYKVDINPNAPYSITWSRCITDNIVEIDNYMLLIWNFEIIKNLISSNRLIENINKFKPYKNHISLMIYGSVEEFKKTKSRKKGTFNKTIMLKNLDHMMLSCGVSFRLVETKNEVGSAVSHLTKSVAQKPYKLNKYKEELEGCEWYASGHSKNCVSVDKFGTGLNQLWRQQLSQFPLCALEASEAIASIYETPLQLLEAYESCNSKLEGELLLQDIPVRRGFGPLAVTRRVGPELSKKIFLFFTDTTGQATIFKE